MLTYDLYRTFHRELGNKTHLVAKDYKKAICGAQIVFLNEEEMYTLGYTKPADPNVYRITCAECKKIIKTCNDYTRGSNY